MSPLPVRTFIASGGGRGGGLKIMPLSGVSDKDTKIKKMLKGNGGGKKRVRGPAKCSTFEAATLRTCFELQGFMRPYIWLTYFC